MGPLEGPLARAINRRVAQLGGEPLRHRMLEGKAQFWVTAAGKTLASPTLKDLAATLGLPLTGGTMEGKSETVSRARAAAITGYSGTTIVRALQEKKIEHTRKFRSYLIDKVSLMKWAEAQRKLGGGHLPRKRRKVSLIANGEAPEPTHSNVGFTSNLHRNAALRARLQRWLDRMEGTPYEMTQEQFVFKAVEASLSKLEK